MWYDPAVMKLCLTGRLGAVSALALCLLLPALPGCGLLRELNLPLVTPSGERLDAPTVARAYPDHLPIGEPLTIEVIRDGNGIRLDNRTARSYENAELWLNHEFGAPLDTVPVGRGRAINIESFTNHFGETYPVAEFLRPEQDRKLVLADLVVDGEIRKLTIRLADDWRQP